MERSLCGHRRAVSDPPLLVVVTGAPASGKTDVAERLAGGLRIPFVVKDTFKETLYETIGSDDGLEDRIERAALEILFRVVDAQLAAGVSVVAESNFDARTDTGPFRRLCEERAMHLVQVHCHRDEEVLLERFAERAESGDRHPGHGDEPEDAAEVRSDLRAGRWEPLELPGTLIEFDKDAEEEAGLLAGVRAAAPD
jgi:predicted kinase